MFRAFWIKALCYGIFNIITFTVAICKLSALPCHLCCFIVGSTSLLAFCASYSRSVAPLAVHFQSSCLDLNHLKGASDNIPIVLHDSVY